MIAIEFLKDALSHAEVTVTPKTLTHALIKLFSIQGDSAITALLERAVKVIEAYMSPGGKRSIETEPGYSNSQTYLRHSKLGSQEASPQLIELMDIHKEIFGERPSDGGGNSARDEVITALRTV